MVTTRGVYYLIIKIIFRLIFIVTDHMIKKKHIKESSPFNPLSANHTKWSNTLKQFVGCCRRIV